MVDWSALLTFAAARPGAPLAMATLVGRRGSSYLAPGARLLIAEDGAHIGALSAGCFEERLAAGAREAGLGAPARRLEVDTLPRYGCPGVLEIFLEPVAPALLPAVGGALAARRPFTLATRLDGEKAGTVLAPPDMHEATKEPGIFLQRVAPRPRVVLVGGEDDAVALAGFVAVLGWERVSFAPVIPADALLARCPPDERTAVVLLTHQFFHDLRLLRALLPAGYPYVGLLGSRRRRESLLAELGAEGAPIDEASLAALRAPVGLDLGADTPAAVALAIVAEIQAAWSGAAGGPLRDRAGPVHATGAGGRAP